MANYIGIGGELVEVSKANAEQIAAQLEALQETPKAPAAPVAPTASTPASVARRRTTIPAVTATAQRPQTMTIVSIVAGLVIAAVLIALINSATPQVERLAYTPAPVKPSAQPTPVARQEPSPLPTARPALAPGLAVYFAPAGDLAPSIKATTDYTPTGRFHEDWVQLTVADYAQAVWARTDSVPEMQLDELPDLAPPPTATPAPLVIVREVQVPVPVACTRENAVAIKSQDVINAKGVPIGHAEAWSCISEADAAAQLQARVAEIESK